MRPSRGVGDAVFQQGRADAADHAAEGLTVGEHRVHDPAGVVEPEQPADPDDAEPRVDGGLTAH